MIKSNFFKSFAVLSLMTLALAGCKKDEPDDPNSTESTMDFTMADGTFSDAGTIADQSEDGTVDSYKRGSILSQCANVTIDLGIKKITINFGATNCVCVDGRNRRGIVYVDYTGQFSVPGNHYVVSFNNYYVNDHKVMGTRTVTNLGLNANNNPHFSVVDAKRTDH